MALFSSVNVRALVPVLACAAGLSWAVVGCDGDNYDASGGPPPAGETITSNPEKAAIDTGASLTTTAGTGVGIFAEGQNPCNQRNVLAVP